jgi:hypothetical protein
VLAHRQQGPAGCRAAAPASESPGRPANPARGSGRCGPGGCAGLGVVAAKAASSSQSGLRPRSTPAPRCAALDVVGRCSGAAGQPEPAQGLGRQDGRGRRGAVQHRARIGQQPVEVGGPEGLTAQQGDALVVRHHMARAGVAAGGARPPACRRHAAAPRAGRRLAASISGAAA